MPDRIGIESFLESSRNECLNRDLFSRVPVAQVILEELRDVFNKSKPDCVSMFRNHAAIALNRKEKRDLAF